MNPAPKKPLDDDTTEPLRRYRFGITEFQSALIIFSMLVGGVAWGLKLDIRTSDNRIAIEHLQRHIDVGILPVTRERLEAIDHRLENIEQSVLWLQRQEADRVPNRP